MFDGFSLDRVDVGDVPIGDALARCDARFAKAWYHWFFFAQPDKPEGRSTTTPTPGTA